jgi:zinc-ribbon domain
MMGGMGGFGLLSCLVGLGLTVLVLGGLVALVLWAAQNMGAKAAPALGTTQALPVGEQVPAVSTHSRAEPRACPNCGQPVQAGWSHCAHCGAPLG